MTTIPGVSQSGVVICMLTCLDDAFFEVWLRSPGRDCTYYQPQQQQQQQQQGQESGILKETNSILLTVRTQA